MFIYIINQYPMSKLKPCQFTDLSWVWHLLFSTATCGQLHVWIIFSLSLFSEKFIGQVVLKAQMWSSWAGIQPPNTRAEGCRDNLLQCYRTQTATQTNRWQTHPPAQHYMHINSWSTSNLFQLHSKSNAWYSEKHQPVCPLPRVFSKRYGPT